MSTSSRPIEWRDPARRAQPRLLARALPASGRLMAAIRASLERASQRRALRELANRDDQHLLRDIGMTRMQAYREAAKWFWQR